MHVFDWVGLLPSGPSPEAIAETLDGTFDRRVIRRAARVRRLARAKNRIVDQLTRVQMERMTRLHGLEWLQRRGNQPAILIFWHAKRRPSAITAALAKHAVRVTIAKSPGSPSRWKDDTNIRLFHVRSMEGRQQFLEYATQTLRQGGTVLIAADGLQRGRGLEVRLFGHRAWLARTFVVLARTTGARVFPVTYSYGLRRIEVRVHPPLEPGHSATRATNPRETDRGLAECAVAWLEAYVRRHPEQAGSLVGAPVWAESLEQHDKDRAARKEGGPP